MEKQQIIAGNETIAKFMGAEILGTFHGSNFWRFKEGGEMFAEDLRYHEDWNWLMKVVIKLMNEHQSDFTMAIYSANIYVDMLNDTDYMAGTSHNAGNEITVVWETVCMAINKINYFKENGKHGT